MSIATPALTNFTAGEISPRLDGRVDISKYFNGCRRLENFHVHPHGGATRRSGLRFVAGCGDQQGKSILVPFEFNAEQTYILEFGQKASGGYMRVFKDQGRVLSEGEPYEISTPYGRDDLESLKYVQSNDTMILVHPNHAPRKLTRTGHAAWTLEAITFTGAPENWREGNYPSVVCFYEERLVFAATPDKPNTIWLSRSGDYYDMRLNTREVPLEGWRELRIRDHNGDNRVDGRFNDKFYLLDGDRFKNGSVVLGEDQSGRERFYRYKGSKEMSAWGADLTVFFNQPPASNQVEVIHASDGSFNSSFWEALETGQRIDNSTGEAPLDDDAIEITLSAAQANAIEFLVPKGKLWVGTIGGEWTVGGASVNEPITPSGVKASKEGTSGASSAMPQAVGAATLYIQRAGRKIREMAYRFDSNAFVSQDLTILSEHITGNGISRLAFAQEPDSVLYCLRNDGQLAALTYQRDQDVLAWTRIKTLGVVESIACIYNGQAKRDELWVTVLRTVNGNDVRFVEFLEQGFTGSLEDGFFVDSGLTYSGAPVSAISGLDHLVGEEVDILADGAVQARKTVSGSGEIVLDRPASVVHAGLPFTSVLQPMRLEAGSSRGTSQTKTKRITQVAVRFHQTLGGKAGPSEGSLETVHFRTSSAPMDSPPELFTGDKRIKFPSGWNRDGVLTVVQDQPLPMTVLLIVPQVVVNE